MSSVYNPEADIMASIERLELEARNIIRRIEHCRSEADKRVYNKQLADIKSEMEALQARLP